MRDQLGSTSAISPATIQLFEQNATKSVTHTDSLIQAGMYVRGNLFVRLLRQRLAKGAAVLDYGCGPGRITRMIATSGFAAHGMDPAEDRIRVARSQSLDGLDVRFSVLSGFGETLESSAYDAIVCSSVIEFVEAPATLLCHFHRALRPDGTLFISFANRLSLYRLYAYARFGRKAPHFAVQQNVWSPATCRRALTMAGFDRIEVPYYFEPPFIGRKHVPPAWCGRYMGTLGLAVAVRAEAACRATQS